MKMAPTSTGGKNLFVAFRRVLPALEVFLMIKIGGKIGALSTVSLILLTAFIGIYFAKIEGIKTMRSGVINLYQNKVPIYEMISGASIAIAALLLIIPGFFTDTVGFLLLIPFTRRVLINLFMIVIISFLLDYFIIKTEPI